MYTDDRNTEFFAQCDGLMYQYSNGHWYKIECHPVEITPQRPSGFKYSLAFFDQNDTCLVRFDNAHEVKIHGRPNPVAWDHWHRFSNGMLVPYTFTSNEKLLSDFFEAIEAYLPK